MTSKVKITRLWKSSRAHVESEVCLSVRKVYYGKTDEWIRMPFGVVSEVGRGMGYFILLLIKFKLIKNVKDVALRKCEHPVVIA